MCEPQIILAFTYSPVFLLLIKQSYFWFNRHYLHNSANQHSLRIHYLFNLPAAITFSAFLVPSAGKNSLAFILEVHADNIISVFVF